MATDRTAVWISIGYSTVLLIVLGSVSYLVWDKPDPIIMYVPLPILQWAFVGGMIGVLHQLSFSRTRRTGQAGFYAWLVAKPVVGLVMGAVVYFVAVSGELALNGRTDIANIQLLNVLAFLGGFSDKYSIELLERITGGSSLKKQDETTA